MTRIVFAAALALAVLPAVSAQAQSPRTFVSAAGSDSNPCSFAAPCRHFQAAVNATSPGGEVDALDPAGYGPITITQAITIEGQGWSYAAPAANSPAITINAVTGNVSIHGVSLNGVGITGTTTGIQFNSGGSLNVRDCVIQNFGGDGIHFQPSASSELSVSSTLIANNTGNGVLFSPGGATRSIAVFNHVEVNRNSIDGIAVFGNSSLGGAANVAVYDSVARGNVGNGYRATANFLGNALLQVFHSVAAGNGTGLEADAASGFATIRVGESLVTANTNGWTQSGNAAVESYADNDINGNNSNEAAPIISVRK
jgi:hypothetical protein